MMAALRQNNNFSLIEHALLCLLKERNKERKKERKKTIQKTVKEKMVEKENMKSEELVPREKHLLR